MRLTETEKEEIFKHVSSINIISSEDITGNTTITNYKYYAKIKYSFLYDGKK